MKRLRIGIAGCGAIGTSLARAVVKKFSKAAKLACLNDINNNKAFSLAAQLKQSRSIVCHSLDALIRKSDLIIEATDVASCALIAKRALTKGRSIIIMSVGGIVPYLPRLKNLARKNQAKVYIPSGAVCGIDALKALMQEKIKKVVLVSHKHPRSFQGIDYIRKKGIKLERIKGEKVLFFGNAREAIKLFPQNINVAATLGIAGIGLEKTRVKIVASAKIKRNIHEIHIDSSSGAIACRAENLVHPDNPKTSFLAVFSAIATLKQILDPVRVGT